MSQTVSLIYAYGLKNAGDMAINLGAVEILQELGFTVKAFSMYHSSDPEFALTKKRWRSTIRKSRSIAYHSDLIGAMGFSETPRVILLPFFRS
ncbi:MAG: hypothetical protein ACOX3I_08810 [Limnochordia bacterium]